MSEYEEETVHKYLAQLRLEIERNIQPEHLPQLLAVYKEIPTLERDILKDLLDACFTTYAAQISSKLDLLVVATEDRLEWATEDHPYFYQGLINYFPLMTFQWILYDDPLDQEDYKRSHEEVFGMPSMVWHRHLKPQLLQADQESHAQE